MIACSIHWLFSIDQLKNINLNLVHGSNPTHHECQKIYGFWSDPSQHLIMLMKLHTGHNWCNHKYHTAKQWLPCTWAVDVSLCWGKRKGLRGREGREGCARSSTAFLFYFLNNFHKIQKILLLDFFFIKSKDI